MKIEKAVFQSMVQGEAFSGLEIVTGHDSKEGALAPEDAKNNTETAEEIESADARTNAAANIDEELDQGNRGRGRRRSERSRSAERKKEQIEKANKALKDAARQLEARLRTQEGATTNTVRFDCDHPPTEKLKEKNETYNKAVLDKYGPTMEPPLFHYMRMSCTCCHPLLVE